MTDFFLIYCHRTHRKTYRQEALLQLFTKPSHADTPSRLETDSICPQPDDRYDRPDGRTEYKAHRYDQYPSSSVSATHRNNLYRYPSAKPSSSHKQKPPSPQLHPSYHKYASPSPNPKQYGSH